MKNEIELSSSAEYNRVIIQINSVINNKIAFAMLFSVNVQHSKNNFFKLIILKNQL